MQCATGLLKSVTDTSTIRRENWHVVLRVCVYINCAHDSNSFIHLSSILYDRFVAFFATKNVRRWIYITKIWELWEKNRPIRDDRFDEIYTCTFRPSCGPRCTLSACLCREDSENERRRSVSRPWQRADISKIAKEIKKRKKRYYNESAKANVMEERWKSGCCGAQTVFGVLCACARGRENYFSERKTKWYISASRAEVIFY